MATPVLYFASLSNNNGGVPSLTAQLEACICVYKECTTLPNLKSKAREIVRSDSLIIAAPHTNNNSFPTSNKELCLISQRGHISSKLSQLSLELIHTVPVSLSLLQMCYIFTLKARLAPKWNEIDKWLVRGNEIFTTGRGQGLIIDVGITKTELSLSLSPIRLTLNLLKPECLEVPTSVLLKFTSESSAVIKETSISCNVCKVLPNLTPAYVYSVSHSLPKTSSGFDTYDKIRLHWKKQYGYVLPPTQSLFYQVFFKFNPTNFLSYPGCCVVRGNPIAVPCRDKEEILSSFITDIHTRMPSLCGISNILYSEKPVIPIASLGTSYNNSIPTAIYPNTRPVNIIPYSRPTQLILGEPQIPSINPGTTKTSLGLPSISAGTTKTSLGLPSISAGTTKTSTVVQKSLKTPLAIKRRNDTTFPSPTVEKREGPPPIKRRAYDHTVPDITSSMDSTNSTNDDIMYGKIEKSKVADLKSWLQSNGVRYHSKDKKDKLVQLVYHHFKMTGKYYSNK